LGRTGADRAHLGHRDLKPGVHDQAVACAARDAADELAAVDQADEEPFAGAHRRSDPQHELVGVTGRGRRGSLRGRRLEGSRLGADRGGHVVVEVDCRSEVAADVVADVDAVDVVAVDGVQQAAGLLGALGRVLRQVARAAPALVDVAGELLDIQLLAPAHGPGAQLVGDLHLDVHRGRAQGVLEQLRGEAMVGCVQLA
jgi:hypothetical protein